MFRHDNIGQSIDISLKTIRFKRTYPSLLIVILCRKSDKQFTLLYILKSYSSKYLRYLFRFQFDLRDKKNSFILFQIGQVSSLALSGLNFFARNWRPILYERAEYAMLESGSV